MCSDDGAKNIWYAERFAKTWSDLLGLYGSEYNGPPSDSQRWVFRGDRPDAGLKTKLERVFEDYEVAYGEREECELETVRAFQRKAALYLKLSRLSWEFDLRPSNRGRLYATASCLSRVLVRALMSTGN